MLAVLAAVVPIAASLYVAGSLLVEFAARDHVARVAERVWARAKAEQALLSNDDPAFNRKSTEITQRRMMLLEANGVDPWVGTSRAFSESARPQAPPRVELRRQWVLLLGSAAGVVLLALEALTA